MFCKQCGQQFADDSQFCPECGATINENSPAPAPVNTPPAKKSSGNVGKIIAICVCGLLLVAAVVIGIFIIKDTLGNSPDASGSDNSDSDSADGENGGNENGGDNQNISGGSSINELNDAYTEALNNVEKDSNQYHLINIIASIQNVIFDSESFEVDFEYDDDLSVEGKLMFGTDLESTNIMVSVENGYSGRDILNALLSEGIFEANSYGDAVDINIAEILKGADDFEDSFFVWTDEIVQNKRDRLQADKEEYEDAKKYGEYYVDEYGTAYYIYDENWYNVEYYNNIDSRENEIVATEKLFNGYENDFSSVKKAANSLFSGNRLNYNSVSVAFDKVLKPYIEAEFTFDFGKSAIPSFDEIWEILYDFIANGLSDDAIIIEANPGSDNEVSYTVELDMAEFMSSLYDYVSKSDKIKAIFGDMSAEMLEELKEIADHFENDPETFDATVETKDGYLTMFSADFYGDTIELEIKNVNSTKITDAEYNRIRNKIASEVDYFTSIDNMDEVLEILNNYH